VKNKDFIWEVKNSQYVSDFLTESKEFGKRERIFLIDQFSGKRPAIINQEFLEMKTISIRSSASAMLDSNIVNLIDSFIQKGKKTDRLDAFLYFLTNKRWDFSLMFYYFEHYAKSSQEVFKQNAVRRTESLLALQSMDKNHYLNSGEVVPDQEAIEYYTKKFGVISLRDVAEARVNNFINDRSKLLIPLLEATEISLTKMVLIRKSEMSKSSVIEQYAEFKRFLTDDLQIMMGRELFLSLHYFCDNAGKLLGIQSNTAFDKAVSIIKSTAWDLFLLKMPEIFLFTESTDDLCLVYIATQEKKLQELARLFSIERIVSDAKGRITPQVSFNLSGIPENIQSSLSVTSIPTSSLTELKNIPVGLHQVLMNELRRFCA
jgi:hypothetical protein